MEMQTQNGCCEMALVHFPDYEPLSVEVEYKCKDCGKIDYLHLYGKEADEWAKSMGNYKKQ